MHIVVIIGGNALAQEVTAQATRVGFAVDVITLAPLHAHEALLSLTPEEIPEETPEETVAETIQRTQYPTARQVIVGDDMVRLGQEYAHEHTLDGRHYIVLLLEDAAQRRALLPALLPTHAKYIGVHSTPTEKDVLMEHLRRLGFPEAEVTCIRCPIGLAIGAQTIEERGIAIVAELMAARADCLPRIGSAQRK